MKVKKILAVLLGAAMVCSMAACGSSSDSSDAAEDTGVAVSEETEEAESDGDESADDESESSASALPFEETVCLDNDYCTLTVKEIDPDVGGEYILKVAIENKTADQDLTFDVSSACVDGVSTGGSLMLSVAAGEEADGTMILGVSDLREDGYTDYTDLEITICAYDSNSYEDVMSDTFRIYPYGEENATTFTREAKDTDQVLIDNDYVKVTMTGVTESDGWCYYVNTFVENKTDKNLSFSVGYASNNISVNEYTADGNCYPIELAAGQSNYGEICIYQDSLTENGIETVQTVGFTMWVYEGDMANNPELLSEDTVSVTVQ